MNHSISCAHRSNIFPSNLLIILPKLSSEFSFIVCSNVLYSKEVVHLIMFSFGGNQQQQQQGGGLFGQQSSTGQFGAAPPLPGQQQSGGLFGSSTSPASSSLFGAAPASTGGGLFGQPASSAPSPFGQPSMGGGGGVFGQQPAATGGLFGSQPVTSPAPSPFGGTGVGASPFAGASTGTSGQKYQTTRDQELNMRLVSISAMDCYKNKSLEELRWEDYQANRGAAPAGATTAWGAAPASTGSGLFGGSTGSTAAPGTTGGGLFGATPAASSGLFGSTSPSQPSSGLFGGSTTSTFGSSTQQPLSSSTTTGGLFGSSLSAPAGGGTGGLFGGSTTSAVPSFGATQQQQQAGTGLFSSSLSTGATGGGLFGSTPATTSGGLFGSSTATAQPTATTGGGLFGSTPSGGLFGSSASTATQPSLTGGGLFGSTSSGVAQQTATTGGGGLFGSTSSPTTTGGGGLFGSTAQPTATGGGGLFGSTSTTAQPTTAGGGLFGSTSATGQLTTTGGGLFGSATPGTTGGGLFGAAAAQPTATTGAGLFGSTTTGGLFGSSSSTANQPSPSGIGLFGSSNGTTSTGSLFGTTSAQQPTSVGGLFGTGASGTSGLSGLFGGSLVSSTPSTSGLVTGGTGTGLGFAQGGLFGSPAVASALVGGAAGNVALPVPRPTGLVAPKPVDKDSLHAFLWREKSVAEPTTPSIKKKVPLSPSPGGSFVPQPGLAALPAAGPADAATTTAETETPLRFKHEPVNIIQSSRASLSPSVTIVRPRIVYTTPTKAVSSPSCAKSAIPVCSNHNIWTKPSLEAMRGMTDQELSRIEHFQIGHYGVGSVTWPGLTDVRFLNIDDDLIQFKKGSVTLFPDEDLKPVEGTGLNKCAVIELFVRPKNYDLAKKYEDRYVDEMRKLTIANGAAEFLSYDLETWRFRVEHFSTWGIDESQWLKIDQFYAQNVGDCAAFHNDLSLFSRIEKDIFASSQAGAEEEEERMQEDDYLEGKRQQNYDENDEQEGMFMGENIGALAVAPPNREELKAMGWELKILDLFLNQSFRPSLGLDGKCWMPEHPVVCNTFNVIGVDVFCGSSFRKGGSLYDPNAIQSLILTLFENEKKIGSKSISWSDLIDKLIQANTNHGVFSLIKALLDDSQSSTSSCGINTAAFNEWLSRVNAETIQKDPMLAFSPAVAMCSRHYSPSASDLLVKAGYPRLALAAAAGIDDASRAIMKEQMVNVVDDDIHRQGVADILGGRSDSTLKESLDWKSELALRYWFSEGDLSGFDPPLFSIEWRIIRAVVLRDAKEILRLVDTTMSGEDLFMIFAALYLLRLKDESLVNETDFIKIILSCSDLALMKANATIDWQLSPILLTFHPNLAFRERMISEIVSRRQEDAPLLIKLGIIPGSSS